MLLQDIEVFSHADRIVIDITIVVLHDCLVDLLEVRVLSLHIPSPNCPQIYLLACF